MDTLVIDLETQRTLPEVGGDAFMAKLGISVAGVYSYNQDKFWALEEHELSQLEAMLEATDHIIGFNIRHFDIPVLEPYLKKVSLDRIANTDMFVDASNFLRHRVGLNALAKATLNAAKSSNGLEALQWFREGRVEDVKKYCLDDVRITRDLYEYGKKNGHVLFESFVDGKKHSIPVNWGKEIQKPVAGLVEEAFQNRQRLSIEYVSSQDDGNGFNKSRMIDIYRIKKHEVEAYCHLRQGIRSFRLNRILKAELTGEKYTIPSDFQGALF